MGISLAQGAGISQGLAQGVQAYLSTRSSLTDEAIKKKLANAQSIEAAAKLMDVAGTDQANPILQKMGMIPDTSPQGLLPDSSASQPPQGPQSLAPASAARDETPAHQSGGQLSSSMAPAGLLDQSTQAQTPSPPPESTDPVEQFRAMQKKSAGLPKFQREGLMGLASKNYEMANQQAMKKWEQEQPQAQAQLKNTQNEPTEKALAAIKPEQEKVSSALVAYDRGVSALKKGGLKSIPIIEDALAQLTTGAGGRPVPIAEQFHDEPKTLAKIKDWYAGKTNGELDLDTAAAIKDKFDLSMGAITSNYKKVAADYEKNWGRMGANPGFSQMGGIASIKGKMGPLPDPSRGAPSRGLLGGDNTATAAKKSGPPGGHQSVTQGGHIYNWNPAKKQYE